MGSDYLSTVPPTITTIRANNLTAMQEANPLIVDLAGSAQNVLLDQANVILKQSTIDTPLNLEADLTAENAPISIMRNIGSSLGIVQKQGTYAFVELVFMQANNVGGVAIPSGTVCTNSSGSIKMIVSDGGITNELGTATLLAYAQDSGSFTVPANTITQVEGIVDMNVSQPSDSASGLPPETDTNYQGRVQLGNQINRINSYSFLLSRLWEVEGVVPRLTGISGATQYSAVAQFGITSEALTSVFTVSAGSSIGIVSGVKTYEFITDYTTIFTGGTTTKSVQGRISSSTAGDLPNLPSSTNANTLNGLTLPTAEIGGITIGSDTTNSSCPALNICVYGGDDYEVANAILSSGVAVFQPEASIFNTTMSSTITFAYYTSAASTSEASNLPLKIVIPSGTPVQWTGSGSLIQGSTTLDAVFSVDSIEKLVSASQTDGGVFVSVPISIKGNQSIPLDVFYISPATYSDLNLPTYQKTSATTTFNAVYPSQISNEAPIIKPDTNSQSGNTVGNSVSPIVDVDVSIYGSNISVSYVRSYIATCSVVVNVGFNASVSFAAVKNAIQQGCVSYLNNLRVSTSINIEELNTAVKYEMQQQGLPPSSLTSLTFTLNINEQVVATNVSTGLVQNSTWGNDGTFNITIDDVTVQQV